MTGGEVQSERCLNVRIVALAVTTIATTLSPLQPPVQKSLSKSKALFHNGLDVDCVNHVFC